MASTLREQKLFTLTQIIHF